MKIDYSKFSYINNDLCLICGSSDQYVLGQRGNREYVGANSNIIPHVYTNIVKCCCCGFIFCNPAIKGLDHLERNHYNNPDEYQSYIETNNFSIYQVGEKLIRKFKPTGNLLDVGAGKGDFVFLSNKNGYKSKGIEPSPRFCDYSKQIYGVHLEQGYLGQKNYFQGEKFDVITLFHVLEHVYQPEQLLKNISGLLKDDGVVYIEIPNANAIILKIFDLFFRLFRKNWSCRLSPLHAPFHSMGYSKKSVNFLLKNSGYKIIYIGTFSGKIRGYNTEGKLSFIFSLCKYMITNFINLFPDRELICIVAKKLN
jgi:SAM-dependent methyltransferase